MKSDYNILWTNFALKELENTIEYLKENWTERELHNLASKLEETLILIAQNPNLFPASPTGLQLGSLPSMSKEGKETCAFT